MWECYLARQEDENEKMHLQAWLNAAPNQTDRNGKPVFKKFSDFYKRPKLLDLSEERKIALRLMDLRKGKEE